MKQLRIGILGPSDIALRRFLPAISGSEAFVYCGVAVAARQEWADTPPCDDAFQQIRSGEMEKANRFAAQFGGRIFESYGELLVAADVDAVYIPLPPGLHAKWGKAALMANKHVLLEKPFTPHLDSSEMLVALAREKGLALHEDYAFCYHRQIQKIMEIVRQGALGELRLIRAAFGFPYRGAQDFRYHSAMGGGALLDCAGYPLKLASLLLGQSAQVTAAELQPARGHDVDVFGSAMLRNAQGLAAHASFGMDNSYACELELWGSEQRLYTDRVFTPPADMQVKLRLSGKKETVLLLEPDDQFLHSALRFHQSVFDRNAREEMYQEICRQGTLIEQVRSHSKLH